MSESTSYDELPYDDKPVATTHPDNLAALATLHNLKPPPPERCRVLELGCAAGHNLMAMAVSLPGAHLTGIDLSPRQIADGTAHVAALGLANVELKTLSILDVDDSLGPFDYIVAHGIYSWVPPVVQDKLLSICARNLAPNGIAYISYNTYPGWHQRGMVREMMGYHVRHFTEPRQRVGQARAFLNFLIEGCPGAQDATTYRRILADEERVLRDSADSYLFHEHLEEVNQPLYFHEFMERAAAKGLRFLTEAQPHCAPNALPAQTRAALDELADDPLRQQQYLDFLFNSTFRRTLLCRADSAGERPFVPEKMTALRFTTRVWPPNPDVDVTGTEVVEFSSGMVRASTNQPLVKAALVELCRAMPHALPFDALRECVWRRLKDGCAQPIGPDALPQALAQVLTSCYASNLIRPHVTEPPFVIAISERPVASPFARWQAAQGYSVVTTLWHAAIRLDDRDRVLLTHLDGSRDRAALASLATPEEKAAGWLDKSLDGLARMALLTA